MSSRITLPLRLVQCDLGTAGTSTASSAARAQVLTPYKPSGLPCYAASQVSAISSSSSSSSSSSQNGGDARRLFAVHTRHTTADGTVRPAFEAAAQPRPEDPSDSLLSRLIDCSLPGCRPYIALPVLSSLLRRSGGSGGASYHSSVTAALLNQWTSRHKGLVLVTHSPSDALFLRNAAQLDLVQQTFRVVCRLPAGVAAAVRRHLHRSQTDRSDVSRLRKSAAAAAALNPYLQAHADRQRRAQRAMDFTDGIPLTDTNSAVSSAGFASRMHLPPGVRPNPLVSGGFFDVSRGLLRVQGSVQCYLRLQTPLHPASAQKVRQFTRLQNLFAAPVSSSREDGALPGDATPHPWLRPEWRIGVSLDAANLLSAPGTSEEATSNRNSTAGSHATRTPAPRGKSLHFDFRLLSVSPHDGGDVALYEVHTRGDTTADEVAAAFHAEGLAVLNDYTHDTTLAETLAEVARRMRAAPPGLLAALPTGVQHYLRAASPEELVALPLTLLPLEDADRLCVQQELSTSAVDLAEDRDRLQQFLSSLARSTAASSGGGGGGVRSAVQRLLWYALESLHKANAEERRAYDRVLTLALGSGVECTSVTYPDPTVPTTVRAMQHVWLTYEQQRQRHPSLAAAARAARQNPAASELQYVRRDAMSDGYGVSRVPLLEDLTTLSETSRKGLRAQTARGECCFSHAVALHTLLDTQPEKKTSMAYAVMSGEGTEDDNDSAPRQAWEQTEVPYGFTEAFNGWLRSTFGSSRSLGGDVRSSSSAADQKAPTKGAAYIARTLWPSPKELQQRLRSQSQPVDDARGERENANAPADGVTHETPTSSPILSAPPAIRLFLRAEELSELTCAHCGGHGHTWQHCGMRAADAVAALEANTFHHDRHRDALESSATSSSKKELSPQVSAVSPAEEDSAARTSVVSSVSATSVMEEEGMTSVDDAAAVLAEQATALAATRAQQRAQRLAPFSADGASDTTLVAVPNVAATQHFKADHALRNESRKPAVHRRAVRCVYCGGRHHITACPKLQAQDGELDGSTTNADSDGGTAGPLFCIKCGQTGHLYVDCPQVPAGLHRATHCAICQQPRRAGSHDPLHCPQRVPVPSGYKLSGIPTSAAAASAAGRAAAGRSGSSGRGRLNHTPRRRGSVLIADSFVDSSSRHK